MHAVCQGSFPPILQNLILIKGLSPSLAPRASPYDFDRITAQGFPLNPPFRMLGLCSFDNALAPQKDVFVLLAESRSGRHHTNAAVAVFFVVMRYKACKSFEYVCVKQKITDFSEIFV